MEQNWLKHDFFFKHDSSVSVLGGNGWYLVVLGQYNWLPLGIKWNLVSVQLLCLFILKNMEIYSDVTIAGQRRQQGKIELLSQWTMEG